MAGVAAEQRVRLAEVSRLAAAHAARKADDLAEARRQTAALQAQLTTLAGSADSALDATAAASGAGLQVNAHPGLVINAATQACVDSMDEVPKLGAHWCLRNVQAHNSVRPL